MKDRLIELEQEIKKIKQRQEKIERRIYRLINRRIDRLIEREMFSVARWAALLTKKVVKIEKDLKKIKKNFY